MRRFIAILAVPAIVACTADPLVAPPIQLDDIRDDGNEFPGVSNTINCDPAPKLIFDKHGEIVDEVYPLLHPSCAKDASKSARPSISVPITAVALGPSDDKPSNETTSGNGTPVAGGPSNPTTPNTPNNGNPNPGNPTTPTAPTNPSNPNPGNPTTPTNPGPTTPGNPTIPTNPGPTTPGNPNPTVPTNPTTPTTPTNPTPTTPTTPTAPTGGCNNPDPCHDHPQHDPSQNDSADEIEKYHPELLGN